MSTSPKQRKQNAHLELASVGAHMYVMTRRKRKRREIDGKKTRTHVHARHTHYVRGKDWKLRCNNDDEVEEVGSGGGGESQGDGRAHPSRPKKEQGPWLAHGSHLSVSVEEEKPVSQLRRPSEAARQLDTQCSLDGMLAASCEYDRSRSRWTRFRFFPVVGASTFCTSIFMLRHFFKSATISPTTANGLSPRQPPGQQPRHNYGWRAKVAEYQQGDSATR